MSCLSVSVQLVIQQQHSTRARVCAYKLSASGNAESKKKFSEDTLEKKNYL